MTYQVKELMYLILHPRPQLKVITSYTRKLSPKTQFTLEGNNYGIIQVTQNCIFIHVTILVVEIEFYCQILWVKFSRSNISIDLRATTVVYGKLTWLQWDYHHGNKGSIFSIHYWTGFNIVTIITIT